MNRFLDLISDWIQPKSNAEVRTFSDFEQLWQDQEAGKHVAFVTVALDPSATSTGDIKDLGLTIWSKRSFVDKLSYHWQVMEDVQAKDTTDFGNPDLFDFGTTQPIRAEDVVSILDDWVVSLSNQRARVCMIVYGEQSVKILERHWKPPVPVDVVDLEMIWRQRCHDPSRSPFKDVASVTDIIENNSIDVNHAGNKAYYMFRLVQSLGKEMKKSPKDKLASP